MKVIASLTHKRINVHELNFSVVYELTFHGDTKFIDAENPSSNLNFKEAYHGNMRDACS